MPTVELDIRQLAEEGGTNPIAPTTVTDAVLDEDGNTLTDILDEINAGLMKVKLVEQPFGTLVGNTDTNVNFIFTLPTGSTILSIIPISVVPNASWDTRCELYNIDAPNKTGIARVVGAVSQGYSVTYAVLYK